MCYAPHQSVSRTTSRRGSLWAVTRREKQEIENKLRPSSPRFAQSFPPRGSLGTRLTIFADFCDSKNKARGRLGTRLIIFADFCDSKNKARGRLGTRLTIFPKFFVEKIRKGKAWNKSLKK